MAEVEVEHLGVEDQGVVDRTVEDQEVEHLGVEDQGVVDRTVEDLKVGHLGVEDQGVVDRTVEDLKVKDLKVKDREMNVGSIMQTCPYNLQPLPSHLYIVKLGLIRVHFF